MKKENTSTNWFTDGDQVTPMPFDYFSRPVAWYYWFDNKRKVQKHEASSTRIDHGMQDKNDVQDVKISPSQKLITYVYACGDLGAQNMKKKARKHSIQDPWMDPKHGL